MRFRRVIVSGRCVFDASEIEQFCGSDAAWVVPVRDDLVDEVGRLLSGGRARRSWLWRHALDVAADAFGLVAPQVADRVGGRGMSRPSRSGTGDRVVAGGTGGAGRGSDGAGESGRAARLTRAGQEALADSVLREQLQRIDGDRLSSGTGMLDDDAEQALVERVLALSVGLGPIELLLADPTVEESWRPGSTWCSCTGPTVRSSSSTSGCGHPRPSWNVAVASRPDCRADGATVQRAGAAAGDAPRRRPTPGRDA